MIEVEVHSSLRDFIREQERSNWPHHLTMARLVARALRLGRSALIQTASSVRQYCLSYLTPILLGDWSVIVVTPRSVQKYLLEEEIPKLKQWLKSDKPIHTQDDWVRTNEIEGLLFLTPEVWLTERLYRKDNLPSHLLTIIDRADELEDWTKDRLTIAIENEDWEEQIKIAPQQTEAILDVRSKLNQAINERPVNPYRCHLLERSERDILEKLLATLAAKNVLSEKMNRFWHSLSGEFQAEQSYNDLTRSLHLDRDNQIVSGSIERKTGEFSLKIAPISVASILQPIWQKQPVVIIGSFLDREAKAPIYRQQLGIEDILTLKFSPNRQTEHIQLYLPDRLPMPNTPEFHGALLTQIRTLIDASKHIDKPIAILVGDVPLKAQIGTTLAAEFGSRVRVEKTNLPKKGILVCGWEFWRCDRENLFPPQLLIIATLPLPSLENPLVAATVAYYKHRHQDWFRLYLLPTALKELQQAILPLRESQNCSDHNLPQNIDRDRSVVAILDNRVNHRSYGSLVLSALEPCGRINYVDPSWFDPI
jgi:ATP-dependent DNA helicase DinG